MVHECPECEYETKSINGLKIHFSKSHPNSDKSVAKYQDSDWLQSKLDEGERPSDLAESLDVGVNTICKWITKFGLDYEDRWEYQTKGDGRYTDEEYLREKYHDEEMSMPKIAEECGVAFETVRYWMHEHNIETREFTVGPEDGPQWWRRTEEWRQTRRNIRDRDNGTCQNCEIDDGEMHVHHIKPVSFGGPKFDEDNLTLLCKDCHYNSHMNPEQSNLIEVSA
jgi:transposase